MYALVLSGTVINVIVWDGSGEWEPPSGVSAIAIPEGSPVAVGYTYANGTFTAPAASAASPTLAQQAQGLIAAGLSITSASTAGVDGTYACDALSQSDIVAIETSLNAGKGFPGGASTFSYPDVTGALHTFSETNFTDLAAAVRDFVYACKSVISGQSSTLPAATAAIA